MKQLIAILILALILFHTGAIAQNELITEIRNLGPNDVKVDGFILSKEQEISIHAIGGGDRERAVYTVAWILRMPTRDVALVENVSRICTH